MQRKSATKIMTGLQSYVHFRYGNYNKNTTVIKNNLIKSVAVNTDLKSLENRLNKYFAKNTSNGKIMGDVPEELLNRFYQEIEQKFNATNLNSINPETLGNQFSKFAKDKKIEFQRQVKLGSTKFYGKTAAKALREIEKRISFLTKDSTTRANAEELLFKTQQEFATLIQEYGQNNLWIRANNSAVNSLAESIAELQRLVSAGHSTAHGAYAEYVVALMAAVAEEGTKTTTNKMLKDFVKNLQHIGGQQTRASFSVDNSHFFGKANTQEIINGRNQTYDEKSGIVYTDNTTSDKVDVNIQFNGATLPASIKNLNLNSEKFNTIHLLSGTGLLALLNQEAAFVNHWLNLSPTRSGGPQYTQKNAPSGVKKAEDENMKKIIAYRALTGGRTTAEGTNWQAKIFVVNDNSTGKFRVFGMGDILQRIFTNLELLNIYTTPDLFSMKNIWIGDSNLKDSESAYRRVTNMLSQLNATKLRVSIDNSIIKNIF